MEKKIAVFKQNGVLTLPIVPNAMGQRLEEIYLRISEGYGFEIARCALQHYKAVLPCLKLSHKCSDGELELHAIQVWNCERIEGW
jgi:hypothetical protein